MTNAASGDVLSRFVLEQMSEPVIVLDALGNVIETNRAANTEQHLDLAKPFRGRNRDPRVLAFLQRLHANGKATLELPGVQAKSGQTLLELRGVALDGLFVVTLERSRKVEALQEEVRQLRRIETLGLLTARIVHDINNLLTPILLLSRDLVSDLGETGQDTSLAQELEATAQRAACLLKSVLNFARPRPPRTESVTLNAAISGMRPLLELLTAPEVNLVLALEECSINVHVDRVQLEQALLNLVSNANHAMPGGGELRITVKRTNLSQHPSGDSRSATHAVLIVSDTGTGMTPEVQRRAFDAFFTTRVTGTGLGLSSVKQFVKENRGFITLDSEAGRGTSIAVHLPVADPVQHAAPV